jgi:hypothetical protein
VAAGDGGRDVSELPLRNIEDAPFCWQTKIMLRKIRNNVADMTIGSSVLKVYSALTEIASDEQSEIFETTHPHIASKALLSAATVKRSLPILVELSAVKITPNVRLGSKMKAPNTYALLPIAHGEPAIAHSCNKGQLSQSRRILEQSKNNDDEKALGNSLAEEQEHATGKSSSSSSSVSDLEEAVATLGDGPLAPAVKQVLSSFLSNSSPLKKGDAEHPWREEARALYPGTDVEEHILRIEEVARKKSVRTLRTYVLACLKKHPPTKRGEKPKRNGPRLDLEAEKRKSIAKADRENGVTA